MIIAVVANELKSCLIGFDFKVFIVIVTSRPKTLILIRILERDERRRVLEITGTCLRCFPFCSHFREYQMILVIHQVKGGMKFPPQTGSLFSPAINAVIQHHTTRIESTLPDSTSCYVPPQQMGRLCDNRPRSIHLRHNLVPNHLRHSPSFRDPPSEKHSFYAR